MSENLLIHLFSTVMLLLILHPLLLDYSAALHLYISAKNILSFYIVTYSYKALLIFLILGHINALLLPFLTKNDVTFVVNQQTFHSN